MKINVITSFFILFTLLSCKKEESENEQFQCREAEDIETANYSTMTEIQVLAHRRDSLITEAENLILCEECETTDWKWTSYTDCDSSVVKFLLYGENTDTIALFDIVNQHKESFRMTEYVIKDNDTGYLPKLMPCVLVMSNEIPSHVECRKGIPVLKMKNK
jgi:hypothetical protein